MSALGSLVVRLGLEYAQFTGGLDKSEQAALAASKKIQDTFDGMKRGLATTAGAIAGGLAAAFTVSAFSNIMRGAVDAGAALDDLRMQTGATVESLSALAEIGRFNNLSAEQIGSAMNKLSANLAGATEESKGAGKALEALGIDFAAFKQMRPEDQMQAVAKAMAQFEDGTGKSAVAMALYGKEGAKMLPFMHDLAEVGELQAKITAEQSAAAAQLDDNWVKLTTTGSETAKEVAMGMVPAFDEATRAAMDVMSGTGGMREMLRGLVADGTIKQWTTDAIKGLSYVADAGQIAWRVLQSIGKGLGGLAAALVQALSGDFRSAWATLKDSGKNMIDVFDGPTIGARFRESLDKVAASSKAAGDSVEQTTRKTLGFVNATDKATRSVAAHNKELEALQKAVQATADARNKEADGITAWLQAQEAAAQQSLRAVNDRIQALMDESSALQMSESLNISLAEAVERTAIARMREKQAGFYEGSEGWQNIEREIQAREQLAGLIGNKAASDQEKEASRKSEEEWKRSVAKYEDIFSKGFADMLNNGKDGWKSFAKSLATTFKTTVADQIYKMFAQPFVVKLVGSMLGVTGASAANAATGGGSILGIASNANSLYNAGMGGNASLMFSDFGMGLTNSVYSAGGALTNMGLDSLGSSVTSFANSISGFSDIMTTAGDAFGYASSIFAAADGKWGQAAGSAIGTYFGGPIGSAIGGAIGGFIDDAFGAAGTQEYGAVAQYSAASGTKTGKGGYEQNSEWYNFGTGFGGVAYNEGIAGNVSGITQSIVTALDATAKTFGQTVGYEAAAGFASDFGKEATWGGLRIALQGTDLVNWNDTRQTKWAPKEFASGEEGYKQYLAAIAKDTRQVLLDMDLPSWADTILTGIGEAATMEQLSAALQQIGTIKATFEQLGETFGAFSGMTDTVFEALMKASGGLEALVSSANAYYAAYYSETERLAQSSKTIERALRGVNAEMPRTKDEFRLMVEALDLNTEAGRAAYVTMMQVAPAFAEVADAASKLAQETATQLLATYSGKGKLVPLLDTTLARFDALGNGLDAASGAALNTGNAVGWINTNLMVASSGLLFFGDRVTALDAPLSGAQLASAALSDQILTLRLNASRSTTDIAGLSAALANVNTETFMATMQGVLARLAEMFSGVLGDISNERISVREAAMQIINPSVMSKSQIQRAIAESNVGMPSNAGVVSANNHLGAVSAETDRLQNMSNWRNAYAADSLRTLQTVSTARNQLAAQRDEIQGALNAKHTWLYNIWEGTHSGYSYGRRKMWSDEVVAEINQLDAQMAALVPQIQAYDSAVANQQANYNAATAEAQQVSAALAAYTGQHLPWALQNAKNAQLAYVDSLQNYAIDASKATTKLGKLREETVKYYESQKALADMMATSASTLRQTVADYRYSQLTPEQQFRSLEGQFNTAYSMALSTSGETLAGYADKMSGLLGPMLDKMAEAGYGGDQSTIAAYLARAEAVAGRVDSLTPTNYAADSLAMLGQIDSTLAALEAGSKSAERIIADAINVGRDQTVNGLRQVVNALTGKGVAAFAAGGMHTGGLRLVGENGPELEVTGPARIYNASQTRAMLGGGGGSNADLLAELRALRAEVRALRAEAQATAGHTAKTARHLDRMDADGLLVRTDADTPLATVPA